MQGFHNHFLANFQVKGNNTAGNGSNRVLGTCGIFQLGVDAELISAYATATAAAATTESALIIYADQNTGTAAVETSALTLTDTVLAGGFTLSKVGHKYPAGTKFYIYENTTSSDYLTNMRVDLMFRTRHE